MKRSEIRECRPEHIGSGIEEFPWVYREIPDFISFHPGYACYYYPSPQPSPASGRGGEREGHLFQSAAWRTVSAIASAQCWTF